MAPLYSYSELDSRSNIGNSARGVQFDSQSWKPKAKGLDAI